MLTLEQYKAFKLEISTFGNIPISSRNCGIGCIFCKVNKDPLLKRFPPIPDISLSDLYDGFKFINPNNNYIRLGAGVLVAPHTDPFLHPDIYEFIKHTADYFPAKKITTVTTGSYISVNQIEYLRSIRNFGIDLSLVTMQEERDKIVPKATRDLINTLLEEAPLNKLTLMFTGKTDTLSKDLELLFSLDLHNKTREILVRRIEHTSYSKSNLNEISISSIRNYEDCVEFLKNNYPQVIYTVPALKDVYRGGNNEYFIQADERIRTLSQRIEREHFRYFNIICPASSYEYFLVKLRNYKNVKVNLIENRLYGGSVTVAGLLNHQDIIDQLTPEGRNDIMVLPYEMYDSEGRDLLGFHNCELKKYYNTELWIV